MDYDVVVVGGGPAGSAAGRAAAAEGADAVVIEKGVPRADREGLGPDSTDAAGILDYWVELMDLDEPVPDRVKHRELSGADFIGPDSAVALDSTGMDADYPNFGFTMHRARFDDWLRERAERAGAEYRVGTGVRDVETDLTGRPSHTVVLNDGTEFDTRYLVLADGPQRTVTGEVLGPLLPNGELDRLDATEANHIAYQEYREIPEELLEPDRIKFWWGYMPGHTAYPWVFPNDGNVARVGLTMPIDLDLSDVDDRDEYALLREDDERVPRGGAYVERLIETVYPAYDVDEFPLRTDRGKTEGTETYPISSTRPIESPTAANVAVAGGAMGATSAFHEGGDHVAVRTGKLAGRLAAQGNLRAYNAEWHRALGEELRRNVAMADIVHDYGPDDWNRAFDVVDAIMPQDGFYRTRDLIKRGPDGLQFLYAYKRAKFAGRGRRYAQIRESEYAV
ncbi:NAD(P)/FAD-dependent oxidoreductase [Halobacteriales archaeon QH_7_66_36]|nr:MAG: NAD(P)/FAD-dependent oxidoreductase [Halobacteriales archaeon QH_7_66_36]